MSIMDLVGVQRGIDFEHSLPTVMRYKSDIREGYEYGSFEPKYGHTLNWQPLCSNSSDLHKEIVLACKRVAKVTEIKNPIGDVPVWHDSRVEGVSIIVSNIIKLCNEIAIATHQGPGNIIVVNTKMYDLLYELTSGFMNCQFITESAPGVLKIVNRDAFKMDFDDYSNYPEAIMTYHSNNSCLCGVVAAFSTNERYFSINTDMEGTENYYRLLRVKEDL